MKKKRFMGFLSLLSCATLLSGCDLPAPVQTAVDWANEHIVSPIKDLIPGSKKEEKKDEDKPTPTPTPTPDPDPEIKVEGLPESVALGTVLDLDEYVTLVGENEYEVVAPRDGSLLAAEHQIMPVVEGEIKFTIVAGELSKECSFVATSSMRSSVESYLTGVGRNYSVSMYDYDPSSGWGQIDEVVHNDLYVVTLAGAFAFVKFSAEDTDAYLCELTYDDEGYYTGVDEESLSLFPISYLDSYYNPELSVDFSETVAEYDVYNETEMIVLSGYDAVTFAEGTMFLPNGQVTFEEEVEGSDEPEEVEYYIERIELVYEEEVYQGVTYSAVSAYAYYDAGEGWELYACGTFYKGEDYESFSILDEFCTPEHKPAADDYWKYFEDFNLGQLFPSPECVLGSAGSIYLEYGWIDGSGNPIDNPYTDPTSYFTYFYEYSTQKFYSETSIWNVAYEYDEETGDPVGMYPSSGKMAVGEEEKVIYDVYASDEGYYLEEDKEHASIWEDSVPTFGALRQHSTWQPGCFAGIYTPEQTESTYYYFAFVTGKFSDIFYSICDADEEGYLVNIANAYKAYAAAGPDYDLFNYTSGYMVVDLEKGYVAFDFKLNFGSYKYEIYAEFSGNPAVLELTSQFEAAASEFIPVAA